MHMKVRHLLVAVRPNVREQPVTRIHNPGFARDLAHGSYEARDLRVARRPMFASSR